MKKILFAFPFLALLAVGCNSSLQTPGQSTTQTPGPQITNPAPAPTSSDSMINNNLAEINFRITTLESDYASLHALLQGPQPGLQSKISAMANTTIKATEALNNLEPLLQNKIESSKINQDDAATLNAKLADMRPNITDANTNANAVASEIATLNTTSVDKNVLASNQTALNDALNKIQTSLSGVKQARQDAIDIIRFFEINTKQNNNN